MKYFAQLITSLYIWIVISLLTIIFSILIVLTSFLLRPFDPNRRLATELVILWSRSIMFCNPFWKLKIHGKGYIRKNATYVLAANHASFGDILCLFCMGRHFKWVAKDSLFKIPFFGWSMSALGYVQLKRGEIGSIRESYNESLEWLGNNVSILIFPEGTRANSGKIGAFKNGAFKLAIEAAKPIVPIAITGTKEMIPRGSFLFSVRTKPTIKILKPIQTSGYEEKDFGKLRDLVREQILEKIN